MMTDIPQPRKIQVVNVTGLMTLIRKECGRFLNVYTQTLVAPIVTMLLFYAVFALALGGVARVADGLPYMVFIAPGLIMMTMAQNAFANTSSSLVISKVQGNIVDVLMPPLSPGELFTGYVTGGLVRGLAVGLVCWLSLSLFTGFHVHAPLHVIGFALMGNYMLSALGVAGGIWSEKFDHLAAVTNFIVTPLTFLSGTFYALESLPPAWQGILHANPFFYMIDGFRYGFTGHADVPVMTGYAVLGITNIALTLLCLWMLKSGYKIKS